MTLNTSIKRDKKNDFVRFINKTKALNSFSSLASAGACEHRQRAVFRAPGSRRLRRLLQPPGGSRPLLRHGFQLLRGDERRDFSSHSEAHPVRPAGAAAAYCVELTPRQTTTLTRKKKCFLSVLIQLDSLIYASLIFDCEPGLCGSEVLLIFFKSFSISFSFLLDAYQQWIRVEVSEENKVNLTLLY